MGEYSEDCVERPYGCIDCEWFEDPYPPCDGGLCTRPAGIICPCGKKCGGRYEKNGGEKK